MTRIGWIGLGKLGFPVAVTLSARVAPLLGYDLRADAREALETGTWPHVEVGLAQELQYARLSIADSLAHVVQKSDLIYVAVETPHGPEHEGVTRLPATKADFDYTALKTVVREIVQCADHPVTIAIISTVLPGTMRREMLPLLTPFCRLVYTPSFVAMGRVVPDVLQPEFILMGVERPEDSAPVAEVQSRLLSAANVPLFRVRIEEAELVKVAYNVFIGQKIVFANTLLQVCDAVGAHVDTVSHILAHARARLLSPAYLRGGLGDSGPCHPRDGIALAWLSDRLHMGYNLFDDVMRIREAQTAWVADRARGIATKAKLPLVVYGKAYKAGTELTTGSSATLLANILAESGAVQQLDPSLGDALPMRAACVVIATPHAEVQKRKWPYGSVIVDPWGIVENAAGITVHRLGRT